MDNLLTPNEPDQIIDDALRSFPMAKMPRDITESVMLQLYSEPAPRFHLTRTDFILAVVFTLVLGAIILGFQFLPAIVILQLRIQGVLLWQSFLVNYRWFLPLTSIVLGTFLAGIAFYQLLRYRRG